MTLQSNGNNRLTGGTTIVDLAFHRCVLYHGVSVTRQAPDTAALFVTHFMVQLFLEAEEKSPRGSRYVLTCNVVLLIPGPWTVMCSRESDLYTAMRETISIVYTKG